MLVLWLTAAFAGDPITLDQALDQAATQNAEVRAASWAVRAAKAAKTEAALKLGPQISVEAGVQYWDQAATVDFTEVLGDFDGLGDSFPTLSDELEGPADALFGAELQAWETRVQQYIENNIPDVPEELFLREQRTTNLKATAIQPITGAYAAAEGATAAGKLKEAAEHGLAATQARIAVDVVTAYTNALAASELVTVNEAVVANLDSALRRVSAFEQAQLVQSNERLQLEVALSNARVELLKAQYGSAIAEKALAMVVGTEADALTPQPLSAAPTLPTQTDADPLRRPEFRQLDAQVDAAKAGKRAQIGLLVPQVVGVAQYERQGGIGDLAIPEQAFVGLTASFDFWGLGQQNARVRKAHAELKQAQAGLDALSRGAALEAEKAWTDALIAMERVSAAEQQVAQATENQRLVDARFDAQLATTTERLGAERLLAQARIQQVAAAHETLVAIATWQRLTGQPVRPLAAE